MLVNILLGILGVLLSLFVFWKRLNEDYSPDIIFQIATAALVGLAAGLTFSIFLIPAWFFWVSLLGAIIGASFMVLKFKLRFYETLEALILAAMPIVSIMLFKDSVAHSSLISFLAFVVSLVFIFFAYWLDVSYKSFHWYKSGRIGFTGLTVAIVFFLARAVVAIGGLTMVSCVGKFEVVISGIVALVCVGLLVNLSRQK